MARHCRFQEWLAIHCPDFQSHFFICKNPQANMRTSQSQTTVKVNGSNNGKLTIQVPMRVRRSPSISFSVASASPLSPVGEERRTRFSRFNATCFTHAVDEYDRCSVSVEELSFDEHEQLNRSVSLMRTNYALWLLSDDS
jgi:hypothetical protein